MTEGQSKTWTKAEVMRHIEEWAIRDALGLEPFKCDHCGRVDYGFPNLPILCTCGAEKWAKR